MSAKSRPAHAQNSKTREAIVAVTETPGGCRNKYKLDEETGRMKLSKVMPEGMAFPFDFGLIPGTEELDGDPLDVLILHDEPTFPGCQIDCRLAGVFKGRDFQKGHEAVNDRIIAVAVASLRFAAVHELTDLDPGFLRQLEEFFINYKKARDVRFDIVGRADSRSAYELLSSRRSSS